MAHSTNWKPTDQVLRQTCTQKNHKSQLKMFWALKHFLKPWAQTREQEASWKSFTDLKENTFLNTDLNSSQEYAWKGWTYPQIEPRVKRNNRQGTPSWRAESGFSPRIFPAPREDRHPDACSTGFHYRYGPMDSVYYSSLPFPRKYMLLSPCLYSTIVTWVCGENPKLVFSVRDCFKQSHLNLRKRTTEKLTDHWESLDFKLDPVALWDCELWS